MKWLILLSIIIGLIMFTGNARAVQYPFDNWDFNDEFSLWNVSNITVLNLTFDNLTWQTTPNCKEFETDSVGGVICVADDAAGGVDTQKEGAAPYLYNDTIAIYWNETTGNRTYYTQSHANATFLTSVIAETVINLSYTIGHFNRSIMTTGDFNATNYNASGNFTGQWVVANVDTGFIQITEDIDRIHICSLDTCPFIETDGTTTTAVQADSQYDWANSSFTDIFNLTISNFFTVENKTNITKTRVDTENNISVKGGDICVRMSNNGRLEWWSSCPE